MQPKNNKFDVFPFVRGDMKALNTVYFIICSNLALVRADVSRLPFSSGSVDAVHAGAALHCWPSPSNAVSSVALCELKVKCLGWGKLFNRLISLCMTMSIKILSHSLHKGLFVFLDSRILFSVNLSTHDSTSYCVKKFADLLCQIQTNKFYYYHNNKSVFNWSL